MSQPSSGSPSEVERVSRNQEYTQEERTLLLGLGHEAILSALEKRDVSRFTPSAHLSEPRGVFTTLYSDGRLRGCVGFPAAVVPLYRAVIETARAAAFEDPRFRPVEVDEARNLKISLSILSALHAISADIVEVGRHGLVISATGRRGLLLPQVPVEHGWDRITFLEQTCMKAGLAPDTWRKGAKIEAFTAEVFSDPGSEGA